MKNNDKIKKTIAYLCNRKRGIIDMSINLAHEFGCFGCEMYDTCNSNVGDKECKKLIRDFYK